MSEYLAHRIIPTSAERLGLLRPRTGALRRPPSLTGYAGTHCLIHSVGPDEGPVLSPARASVQGTCCSIRKNRCGAPGLIAFVNVKLPLPSKGYVATG